MARFDTPYATSQAYFGLRPSFELAEFVISRNMSSGYALDLGCGQGRNALFLAERGFSVLALDVSSVGLDDLAAQAREERLDIRCVLGNVVTYPFPPETFDLVVASTILDNLPVSDILKVSRGIVRTLAKRGIGYVSVFTTSDPGYRRNHDQTSSENSASECADAIRHYFEPGELRALFENTKIIQYKESQELDTKHGPAHWHGIARLIFEKR